MRWLLEPSLALLIAALLLPTVSGVPPVEWFWNYLHGDARFLNNVANLFTVAGLFLAYWQLRKSVDMARGQSLYTTLTDARAMRRQGKPTSTEALHFFYSQFALRNAGLYGTDGWALVESDLRQGLEGSELQDYWREHQSDYPEDFAKYINELIYNNK